jgi:putative FmdB family regulatory protein
MPIYAYRCATCGHAQDVLQKMSDPVLAVCPACGAATYAKQVTAAGFQLKGSGWYVTDFRDGPKKPGAVDSAAPKADSGEAAKPAEGASPAADKAAPAAKAEPASAPAPSPAPAAASSGKPNP